MESITPRMHHRFRKPNKHDTHIAMNWLAFVDDRCITMNEKKKKRQQQQQMGREKP